MTLSALGAVMIAISFGGDNTIGTGGGNDYIQTGGGNDWIVSGDGDDIIYGGGGRNYMNAGAGDDLLVAQGTVIDAMSGGGGADTFDITQAQGDVLINDFSFAEGDVLRMGASVVGSALPDLCSKVMMPLLITTAARSRSKTSFPKATSTSIKLSWFDLLSLSGCLMPTG